MSKSRILFIVPNLRIGTGVTSVIMNHYDKLIKKDYHIDFCALQNRESPFTELIKQNDGHIYFMPEGKNGYPSKTRTPAFLKRLIQSGNYNIVHTNIVGRFAVYIGYYSKKYGVPYRIYHAHNPRDIHDIRSLIASFVFDNMSVYYNNRYLACSKDAGYSVFGKRKFEVIRNTINTDEFKFSSKNRYFIRKELNISDKTLVVGTVCRISYQKNPFFIIDIFYALHKYNKNSVLLWAGTGELDSQIKQYVKDKCLENFVLFLGSRSDITLFYSAMDIFVLPSRYEGLGIVYIEAQASGLPTFASDVVPMDTRVTDLIEYIPLSNSVEQWLDRIKKNVNLKRSRTAYAEIVRAAGYDSKTNSDLIDFYKRLC